MKRVSALRLIVGTLALAGLAASVSAQPAPAPGPAIPVPQGGPVVAPPSEEAPPIDVAPPAPMVVPSISPKEVAPAAPPKDQVAEKATTPVRRTRYDIAVLQALDKVTAETVRFEAAVGRPVRYKSLIFTVKACERSAPDEPVEDSIAYMTVDSQPRPEPGKAALPPRQAFKGWMFASSPSLNPLEHPVYAAWLISCRSSAPVTPPAPPRAAPVAPKPAAPKPAAPKPEAAPPEAAAAPAPKAASPAPKPAVPPNASPVTPPAAAANR